MPSSSRQGILGVGDRSSHREPCTLSAPWDRSRAVRGHEHHDRSSRSPRKMSDGKGVTAGLSRGFVSLACHGRAYRAPSHRKDLRFSTFATGASMMRGATSS